MPDLSAHVFYKLHLDLVREDDQTDLLRDVIVKSLIEWLSEKYPSARIYWQKVSEQFALHGNFPKKGDLPPKGCPVYARTASHCPDDDSGENGERYWACWIEEFESASDGPSATGLWKTPRSWTTEVGFEQTEPGRATISYVCYYTDRADFFGVLDEPPKRNIPSFVHDLICSATKPYHCEIGSDMPRPIAVRLPADNVQAFADRLTDTARKLPLILVVPSFRPDAERFPADELAQSIMGNAIVYEAERAEVAGALEAIIGRENRCLPGQIRLYYPTFDGVSYPSRFLTANNITALGGSEGVIQLFRRILGTNIHYSDSREMFRMQDCYALYRQSRQEQLSQDLSDTVDLYEQTEERLAESQLSVKEARRQLSETKQDRKKIREERDQIKKSHRENLKRSYLGADQIEIRKLQAEIQNLEEKISDQARAHDQDAATIFYYMNRCSELKSEADRASAAVDFTERFNTIIGPYIKNRQQLADIFEALYPKNIVFSPEAKKCLADEKECVTSKELLWNCFYAMATELHRLHVLRDEDVPKGQAEFEMEDVRLDDAALAENFYANTSFELALHESPRTMENPELKAERKATYNGEKLICEPHVCKGNDNSSPTSVRAHYTYYKDPKKKKLPGIIVVGHVGRHLSTSKSY